MREIYIRSQALASFVLGKMKISKALFYFKLLRNINFDIHFLFLHQKFNIKLSSFTLPLLLFRVEQLLFRVTKKSSTGKAHRSRETEENEIQIIHETFLFSRFCAAFYRYFLLMLRCSRKMFSPN